MTHQPLKICRQVMEMQIKRSIEKIPGDDARPAIPWRTVPHLLAGGGKYFWIIHQRDD